jgi:hypothetical protein
MMTKDVTIYVKNYMAYRLNGVLSLNFRFWMNIENIFFHLHLTLLTFRYINPHSYKQDKDYKDPERSAPDEFKKETVFFHAV